MSSFKDLNLNPKILEALESKGYSIPTPIQSQAIPYLLEGKDLLGIAQTGTGKTAAFSLPILHNLSASNVSVKSGGVRTLILTPTRELASQIANNIELYGKDLNLSHAVIFGGVSERPQITTMQRGVDILIATPGRLLDLMGQGYIRFMQLEVLVLDEADRMLDMGFINDIKKIIAKIPEKRQTLFFSATMPEAITELANSILKDPVRVEVTPESTTVERIDQKINYVEKGNKLALLKRILKQDDATSVLVFSKTKHGANRIEEFLQKNSITAASIHGNKSQGAREKALESFREGKVQVLIATDIAARGIDIPAISHVINYDIPMDPESYVHRIGRTARAGKTGIAISFCDSSEKKLLQAVEKSIRYSIPVDETHPFHGVASAPVSRSSDDNDSRSNSRPRRSVDSGNSASGRGERRYGHSVNKGRHISESSSGRDPRSQSRDGSRNRRPAPRRPENINSLEEQQKSGILSFIGLGKKKSNFSKPKFSRDGRFGDASQKKQGGFSLGSLFGIGKGSESGAPRHGRDGEPFGGNRRGEGRRSSSNFGQTRRGDDRRGSSNSGQSRREGFSGERSPSSFARDGGPRAGAGRSGVRSGGRSGGGSGGGRYSNNNRNNFR